MKKYNEKMIVRNGKMIYAISLEDKNTKNSDATHIMIENGKVYFSNNWYSGSVEFNFNDEAHKIAKEIFVSQLQVDIKRRILELKQLEEIFESLDLKECLGNSIYEVKKIIVDDYSIDLITNNAEVKVNDFVEKEADSNVKD